MAGQPQFGAAREDFNGLNSVVSGLVKTLNSAIYNAGEAFAARENEFKREIQVLQQKLQIEKLGFEKERNELFNRLKEKEVDLEEIMELKKRNCELECEKLRAKSIFYNCQKRIKELEAKVFSLEKKAAERNAGKRKWRGNFVGNEAARKTNVNSCDWSSQWERTGNTTAFVEHEAPLKTNVNPSDRSSSQWERTGKTKEWEVFLEREALRKANANPSDSSSQWERAVAAQRNKEREALQKTNINQSDSSSQWERAVAVQRNSRESFVEREALLRTSVNPIDSSSQWERTGDKSKADATSSKTDDDVYEKTVKELEERLLVKNVEKDASTPETNSGKRKVSEENTNAGVGSSGKQRHKF